MIREDDSSWNTGTTVDMGPASGGKLTGEIDGVCIHVSNEPPGEVCLVLQIYHKGAAVPCCITVYPSVTAADDLVWALQHFVDRARANEDETGLCRMN